MLLDQNSESSIRKLRAQRALYSSAKKKTGTQIVLNVIGVVLISIIALCFSKGWMISGIGLQKQDLSWLVAAYSITIIFLDSLLISPVIENRKELAAKIQQSFDMDVLGIRWDKSFYGEHPDHELIMEWSNKFRGKEDKLVGWYPSNTSELPVEVMRIICQRSNCWWDSSIRTSYNNTLYFVGGTLFLTLCAVAIAIDLSLQSLFSLMLAPIIPFFLFTIKTTSDNKKVICRLKEVILEVNDSWGKLKENRIDLNQISSVSNSIQHSIYLNRKESPLMFDFTYFRSRDEKEEVMNKSSDEYIAEYQRITSV